MNNRPITLSLQNFQGIENAILKFGSGITAITGPNSSGKTSVFRALRAILLNPTIGKHYVKKGCKETKVSLQVNGCPEVTWIRTRDSSAYNVEGSGMFDKAGRRRLHDYLPEYPLSVDETGRAVNVQSEWDVLFPFDKSSTELFKLFEDIFGIVDSAGILGLIASDDRDINSNLSAVKDRITVVDDQKDKCKDVLVGCDTDKLLSLHEQVISLFKEVDSISSAVEQVIRVDKALDTCSGLDLDKTFNLEVIPEYKRLEKDVDISEALNKVLAASGSIPDQVTVGLDILKDYLLTEQGIESNLSIDKALSALSKVDLNRQFDLSVPEQYIDLDKVTDTLVSVDHENKMQAEELHNLEVEHGQAQEMIGQVENCPLCGGILHK